MFNYRLKCINVYTVFKYVTILSLIIGGVWGLFMGLLAHDMVGIPGGLFFGLIFGLFNGLVASLYTFLFNLFASSLGGIEIQLERKDDFLDSLVQPLPLVTEPVVPQIVPQEQEHLSKSDAEQ